MAKFPEPPSVEVLQNITPSTLDIPAGTTVARIYFAGGDHPTSWAEFRHFGPLTSRFDHHLTNASGRPYNQGRGIMYLAIGAQRIPTCLAEVYQASRTIDRTSRVPILVGFDTERSLRLLDLTGPFSTAIGASTAIHSGPRPRARRWARQLYDAYTYIDGIQYCSSMNGSQHAIALFERGQSAIPSNSCFHRSLSDPVMDAVITETGNSIAYATVK